MSTEYIERGALIAEIEENIATYWNSIGGGYYLAEDALNESVKTAPAADVVEVVRCKECRFNVANMQKDPLDITDYSGDDIVCSYFMTDGMRPDDYCSNGKRGD